MRSAYDDHPETFHEWRKRVKDLTNQAQFLAPLWPEIFGGLRREFDALGDILGDDHDLCVVRGTVLAEGESSAPRCWRSLRMKLIGNWRAFAVGLGRWANGFSPSDRSFHASRTRLLGDPQRGALVKTDGRLIVLSGPSCVGKSPLFKVSVSSNPSCFPRCALVLYNSRSRPGERMGRISLSVPGGNRTIAENGRFVVIDVRGPSGARCRGTHRDLRKSDMLFEGNPFIGETLLIHEKLKTVSRLSVSPLASGPGRGEISQVPARRRTGCPDRRRDATQTAPPDSQAKGRAFAERP